MKNKRKIIICIICCLVILSVCICFKGIKGKENVDKNKFEIDIAEFNLKKRTKLVLEDEVLIGNNLKELQNNFYDIKLQNNKDGVYIYLNKLWYLEYDETYIEDEYLANICREIVRLMDEIEEKEEMEYRLYKYIKENFEKVKKGGEAESFTYNKLNISSSCIDGECVLKIKRE